jgi:hypothetical protein
VSEEEEYQATFIYTSLIHKGGRLFIKPSTNKAINIAQLCTSFCGGYNFTQLHHKIT